MENYIKEVKRIREETSLVPSEVTPAMIKMEVMDPELVDTGRKNFNLPWFTGYSPTRYCLGLDLLIQK